MEGRKIKQEELDDVKPVAASESNQDLGSDVERKPKKITLAALQLAMPSKRKADSIDRPFAPKEKARKVKKPVGQGQIVETRPMQQYKRSDVQDLKYVRTLIEQAETATKRQEQHEVTRHFDLLRKQIHEIEFTNNLSPALIAESKLLADDGLVRIVERASVDYPSDLVADTMALYNRWCKGDTDPFLLRGIELKSRTLADGKRSKSRNLHKAYPFKISPTFVGAGHLVNGQWWPHQICSIRDGAHGAIEAGIFGEKGKGALSIVIGSSGYANEDQGNIIKYCGTSGSLKMPTENTKLMIESQTRQTPVRVIRSGASPAKKHTVYQPIVGLRYDGLYQVIDNTLLHEDTAMYQFTLKRLPGQDPIRFKGVEMRPTPEEGHAHNSIREALGYSS